MGAGGEQKQVGGKNLRGFRFCTEIYFRSVIQEFTNCENECASAYITPQPKF